MITDAIVKALAAVLHWIMGALPVVSVPSWLAVGGPMSTIFQDAGLMGVWFPMTLLAGVLALVLSFWLAGFGIKITRIVASFFTVGGGSAG